MLLKLIALIAVIGFVTAVPAGTSGLQGAADEQAHARGLTLAERGKPLYQDVHITFRFAALVVVLQYVWNVATESWSSSSAATGPQDYYIRSGRVNADAYTEGTVRTVDGGTLSIPALNWNAELDSANGQLSHPFTSNVNPTASYTNAFGVIQHASGTVTIDEAQTNPSPPPDQGLL